MKNFVKRLSIMINEFKTTKNDKIWKNRNKFEKIWKIEMFNRKLISN